VGEFAELPFLRRHRLLDQLLPRTRSRLQSRRWSFRREIKPWRQRVYHQEGEMARDLPAEIMSGAQTVSQARIAHDNRRLLSGRNNSQSSLRRMSTRLTCFVERVSPYPGSVYNRRKLEIYGRSIDIK
jgi:hypothetical protein